MSTDPQALAAKLLDAHVAHLVAEATDKFPETAAREVDWVLETAATIKLGEVVSPDDIKAAARVGLEGVLGGTAISDALAPVAEALYNLPEAGDHKLGDVVPRESFEAIVDNVLANRPGQNRFMDRLIESPSAALVAAAFTGKIVDGMVAGQRQKVEKVPGMGSMFSLGGKMASAAARATGLDAVADKGAVAALKATEQAVRELLKDGPIKQAAMEVWDIHAAEPVSELRKYATLAEVQQIATIVDGAVREKYNDALLLAAIDAVVDVLDSQYRDVTVAALLEKLGFGRAQLLDLVNRFGPKALNGLAANGVLAAEIRKRLEVFYLADSTLELIAE